TRMAAAELEPGPYIWLKRYVPTERKRTGAVVRQDTAEHARRRCLADRPVAIAAGPCARVAEPAAIVDADAASRAPAEGTVDPGIHQHAGAHRDGPGGADAVEADGRRTVIGVGVAERDSTVYTAAPEVHRDIGAAADPSQQVQIGSLRDEDHDPTGGHIGRYVARQCKRARTVVEENGTRRAAAGGELPIAIRTVTITGIVQIIGKLVHRREPDGVVGRVSGAQGTRLADIAD